MWLEDYYIVILRKTMGEIAGQTWSEGQMGFGQMGFGQVLALFIWVPVPAVFIITLGT